MSTSGRAIECRAAVFIEPNKPLTVEQVLVDCPQADEVRVKLYASGVCRSDASSIWGKRGDCFVPYGKPMINGHEGSGVVESVGEQVTDVEVGDHVVLLWLPQCNQCVKCKNPTTNTCMVALSRGDCEEGWLPADGISRFHLVGDGRPVLTPSTNCNLATFAEYCIAKQSMVVKIDKTLPLDVMSVFGCALPTGYGAAANVAKVHAGSTCAVWGLGAVGMAVVLGCKLMGANVIIGLDINSDKYETAKQFGCNQFINPLDTTESTDAVIKSIFKEGVDYTFDCIGNQSVIEAAIRSLCPSGTFVAVGLLQPQHTYTLPVMRLLDGLTLTGGLFGK
ncbi:unnamed protein product [Medioppia subpectinata]|uniref:Alcohol dehydrogenase n=1 Tax=Medioppia subpectinata TaxID=1979941 RepID=A0A7R9KRF0_9ACAR|nr:unnamed protein product [Medioppia subpectinata]CAG2108449.1 unnamed protein product [Medioppia subpectinata]